MKKVNNNITNIGVDDYEITLFESQYELEKGMAYNSYLIKDSKNVIMDSVDASVTDKWMTNLEEALGDGSADYLVISHMEPDHSAGIAMAANKYPDMKLVGNVQTFNMLKQFYPKASEMSDRFVTVKEGDTINIGERTLTFYFAPMVHWPEVMVTYDDVDKTVFSADGFGKFGTTDADEDWACEARRYYFNICGKYGVQVQNLLKKLKTLDVEIICPLHGPILDKDLDYYIGKYDIWSRYEPEDEGVFIAYASIHGNTKAAAERMKEILEDAGAKKVAIADLAREDIHESVEDAFRYDTMILASATYDAGIFPPMQDFISRLKAKNYQKRRVAFIENGTWAPMAAKLMKAELEAMKDIEALDPVISIKSAMTDANEEQMRELAKVITK